MSTNLFLDEKPRDLAHAKAAAKSPEIRREARCELHSTIPFPEPVRPAHLAAPGKSVKRLPGEFAHQLNNLLTVILGHTEFLLKRKESPEVSRLRVEEIRRAAESGIRLTNQLLHSTGLQPPAR
ncbi:MAG: hypothetical protein LAO08_02280 [Acidobacteriia bacterium]|nr:hypothetical protein [Terriglobia bacterium]